ncbi:MAG: beta-N-acetylhexosaminidase [Fimbriimonadaceae bacterium]
MCPIIPMPVQYSALSGQFNLDSLTLILVSAETKGIGQQLQQRIETSTGLKLKVGTTGTGKAITLKLEPDLKRLGDEGYRLEVGPQGVSIRALKPAGVYYAVQSLLQLFPASIYAGTKMKADWTAPACSVEDYPRFKWRGGHLDVGRHFMPAPDVKRFIDGLAMHKMNTFHWHLTEDQGWRIEIKRYPKLTEVGSKRADTMLNYSPAQYEGKPHGGFYTQSEVRDIVKYAAERFVTIVPEIEMPGHATAAIAAYPELGNSGKQIPVATTWGVVDTVLNTEPGTIKFMQNVLDEVIELFPGQFIHIGGDECPKKEWKESKATQDRMVALGLKTEHEMQSWFIRQMDQHLTSKGRRLIGWSEILEGGLAPGAGLMVWLGNEGAMEAVRSGHDVVMAQTTHTYFDFYQSRDTANEPKAIGGFLPLDKAYAYEPILPEMTAADANHVLGCQFQMWTEYIGNYKKVEYMAYPRASALSEVAWSQKSSRDFANFSARLGPHLSRLEAKGINFRKP